MLKLASSANSGWLNWMFLVVFILQNPNRILNFPALFLLPEYWLCEAGGPRGVGGHLQQVRVFHDRRRPVHDGGGLLRHLPRTLPQGPVQQTLGQAPLRRPRFQ